MDSDRVFVDATALELVALTVEMEVTEVWASSNLVRRTDLMSARSTSPSLTTLERRPDTRGLVVLVERMAFITEARAVVSPGYLLLE